MSIVVLKLSDVKGVAEDRPTHCPSCKGDILRRWGGSVRKIRDQRVKVAIVYRYRCCVVGTLFGITQRGWIKLSRASQAESGTSRFGLPPRLHNKKHSRIVL